ncbi:MAG: ubiquinone biosynthesis protein [Oleispira sp.]
MANIWRLWKILYIFTRYRLDDLIPTEQFPLPLRIALWLAPWRLAPVPKKLSRGERLRLALEALGPIFVKFGQILSTRPDLIPDDIVNELINLQDNVPPFASDIAVSLIESELGESVDTLFAQFDPIPMASASIAQVHPATLHDGTDVVVKVVRPGIYKTIDRDIILLDQMARLVEKYSSEGRRLKPVEVVDDYSNTIHAELNLAIEASNATQLRRNFEGSDLIYVPEVYWDFTRTSVMVSERIYGIPVADIEALKAQNTNMKVLAERGVEIFFTQVFRDSFFHADMHPGNIFVAHGSPEKPKYIAIDCGIVGTLNEQDQHYLARNLLAFFNQDYYQVAQLHIDSGWVPSNTKVHELESAIRSVCEPIFEKPIAEISFGQVLLQLFRVARRFNMEVQPQLVLLQKTLLNIEGLGRQLYPELDLWNTAKPYMERWIKERFGPQGALRELKRQLPNWIEKGPQIPGLIHSSLSKLSQLDSSQAQIADQLTLMNQEFAKQRQQNRQQKLALVTMASGGVLWWQAAALAMPETLGMSLAAFGALWLLIRG